MRRLALVAGLVALFQTGSFAQGRMGASGGHGAVGAAHHAVTPAANRNAIGISGVPFGRFRGRGFRGAGFGYGWPYGYADFYPDSYDYYQNEPPAPPAAPEPPAPQVQQAPLPSPALLELQGNQWVKVNSFTMAPVQTGAIVRSEPAVVKEMPPTVLIYRDGHSEELTNYMIAGDSIQTKSDYWSKGSWTRTIQISDLDLPATFKQNQQRGVKFELPSGPGEVMIRP